MTEKQHYIYETTNNINGRTYIGIHSYAGDFADSGYIGSGKALELAIEKYGKENFTTIVLYEGTSRVDISEMEKSYVNSEFVERKDTCNIDVGGDGIRPGSCLRRVETKLYVSNASEHEHLYTAEEVSRHAFNSLHLLDSITSSEVLSLWALVSLLPRYLGHTIEMYVSREQLAHRTATSRKASSRAIKRLEGLGFISNRTVGSVNFTLNIGKIMSLPTEKDSPLSVEDVYCQLYQC